MYYIQLEIIGKRKLCRSIKQRVSVTGTIPKVKSNLQEEVEVILGGQKKGTLMTPNCKKCCLAFGTVI